MRHRITVRDARRDAKMPDPRNIRDAVSFTLEAENIKTPCDVTVIVTDDREIQEVNRKNRNQDAPTDVLSFPMQTLEPGNFQVSETDKFPGTNRLPLGDIILSAERARAQAGEYGHTPSRELSYLIVHSVLHLLGYDHTDEGAEKQRMRGREKEIMRRLGYDEAL